MPMIVKILILLGVIGFLVFLSWLLRKIGQDYPYSDLESAGWFVLGLAIVLFTMLLAHLTML